MSVDLGILVIRELFGIAIAAHGAQRVFLNGPSLVEGILSLAVLGTASTLGWHRQVEKAKQTSAA